MTNLEKYINAFAESLEVAPENVEIYVDSQLHEVTLDKSIIVEIVGEKFIIKQHRVQALNLQLLRSLQCLLLQRDCLSCRILQLQFGKP